MSHEKDNISPPIFEKKPGKLFGKTTCGIGCFVVLLIGIILLIPAIQAAREAARCMQCGCGCVKLAFYNYHDAYGAFPPAYTTDNDGKPLHSWRVLLLPYLEQQTLYSQIRLDEPWNSEHNKQFHNMRPGLYGCPSDFGPKDDYHTNYLRITGPGTLTDGPNTVSLKQLAYTSTTILYVESTRLVCWMAPEDLDIVKDSLEIRCHSDDPLVGIGSRHQNMVWICMADSSRFLVSDKTPETFIQAAALRKWKKESDTNEK